MFALQTAPPRLGLPVAVLLGLVLLGGVAGALGTVVVRRLSNPVGKHRLLYGGVLFPFALLAYALLALLGFGTALATRLLPNASGLLGTVLADYAALLAAGLVWLAAYAPTVRGVRRVRDVELSTGRALGRMARYVVGASALVAVLIAPLRLAPSGDSPVVPAAGVAAIGVVLLFASPWLVAVLRASRAPTGDTTDRLATLRARAGLDVRDVLVLETDDEETATAHVRGVPGYRRLLVTSTFLDRFDDDTATALLAVQAGRLRAHLLVIRVGTVVAGGLLLVAGVTGAGSRWVLLGLSFGVVLVGLRLSRRGVCVADDVAAERVGAAAVVDALERHGDAHGIEPSRRRVPNPLSPNVALGDRIDRLRYGADG